LRFVARLLTSGDTVRAGSSWLAGGLTPALP
jgi:hypothetical protein